MDAGLHDALRAAARDAGISLNEYCVRALAGHATAAAALPDAAGVVTEAARLLGSWARGEAATGSDVDVLLVTEARVGLRRDLYRRWDAEAHRWSGRPVDAHFAHLPDAGSGPSGFWADVVRESQEALELALKGLLRASGVEPPRIHDVADVLIAEQGRLPPPLQKDVERLAALSRDLRRDRELAFSGAEDLTPSRFYREADATRAREAARTAVTLVKPFVLG